MTELQFRILLMYKNNPYKDYESNQFRVLFLRNYPQYNLEQIEKELRYLNGNGYLEANPDKAYTLRISQFGYLSVIKQMQNGNQFIEDRLPITKPAENKADNKKQSNNNLKEWILTNKDDIIKDVIVGIIVALIVWIISTIIF